NRNTTVMSSQQPKSSNQWSTEVFDCCISIFCFPCVACTTAKRYGECFCLPLIDEFGLMRVSMRHRYGIEVMTFDFTAKDAFLNPFFACFAVKIFKHPLNK
uniref:Uncharacterized protein n=1 Tax=Sinocyclocheilus rhinocerous TaxID=307959 RepID=A0A673LTQ5_9TELE